MSKEYKVWKRLHKRYYDGSPGQSWFATYDNFDEWFIKHADIDDEDVFCVKKIHISKPWTSDNAKVVLIRRQVKPLEEQIDTYHSVTKALLKNERIRLKINQWNQIRNRINDECDLANIQFRTIRFDNDIVIER